MQFAQVSPHFSRMKALFNRTVDYYICLLRGQFAQVIIM